MVYRSIMIAIHIALLFFWQLVFESSDLVYDTSPLILAGITLAFSGALITFNLILCTEEESNAPKFSAVIGLFLVAAFSPFYFGILLQKDSWIIALLVTLGGLIMWLIMGQIIISEIYHHTKPVREAFAKFARRWWAEASGFYSLDSNKRFEEAIQLLQSGTDEDAEDAIQIIENVLDGKKKKRLELDDDGQLPMGWEDKFFGDEPSSHKKN